MPDKKTCLKNCYDTRKEARKKMNELNKVHHFDKPLTDIYFCDQCTKYHLTTMPKQRSRDYRRFLNKRK